MDYRSEYLFEGSARYSYGWQNPNHSAAVIACIIPLFWVARSFGRRSALPVAVSTVVEATLTVLLVLTYSRGALLGYIAAIAVYSCPFWRADRKSVLMFLLPRCAFVSILCVATGLGKRFMSIGSGDQSAIHRLDIWSGGFELLNASPLRGWGSGNSGLAYMEWVQDSGSTTQVGGMVNSFLHVAVEYGLGGVFLLFFLYSCPVFFSLTAVNHLKDWRREAVLSCTAGLICFYIASCFNTLWLYPSVTWGPVLLCLIVYLLARKTVGLGSFRRIFNLGLATAAALAFTLYLVSDTFSRSKEWRASRESDRSIVFTRSSNAIKGVQLTFVCDQTTLGAYFGKYLRESEDLFTSLGADCIRVYPPGVVPQATLRADTVFIFGARAEEPLQMYKVKKAIFICPTLHPPKAPVGIDSTLIMPEFDELGYSQEWIKWGLENGSKVMRLENSGQDIRWKWRAICSEINLLGLRS